MIIVQLITNTGTVPKSKILLPILSVKYPVGKHEIAAPIVSNDPTEKFSLFDTENPASPFISFGPAGEDQPKVIPTAKADKHAENSKKCKILHCLQIIILLTLN